ncbi:MAG TPA: hypothetical protein VFM83_09610 [Gaiellaceae bacterium]|nr:hypothetical protein [Gaiellaceae bacterium]
MRLQPHEREVFMLRRKRLLLCLCTVSFLATFFVTSAWSAPDPTANKNAISIDLDCGGYHVVATGIFQSHSPTFHVVSSQLPGVEAGSVGPTFGYDAWDNPARAGEPVASFRAPGFFGEHTNGQQLTTCDFVLPNVPDTWFTGYFMFTPRGG